MARPTVLSDEKILKAARRVFLERGISGTTAEVARAAGVAEGSLFKRWKTKHELFFAALSDDDDEELSWIQLLASRVGRGDVRENLYEAGTEAHAFFKSILPLIMMAWSNKRPGKPPAPFDTPNPKPARMMKRLAGYFEAEMRKGRIARTDAEVLARTFVGSIWHFAFFETVVPSEILPMPAEMFLRGFVQMMWNGIRPPRKGAAIKEKAR